MNIHTTTQDLNSLVHRNQLSSTSSVSSKDFRLKNYSEQMLMPKVAAESADFYSSAISFKGGKKPTVRDAKKIIETGIKKVGDIKKEPNPEIKRGDKLIEHPLFNWVLSKYEYEPVIQAAAAALICMALRPATIMALPSKGKSKEDNTYAASHSFASGIMGLVSAILITAPFKKGGNYVTSVMRKNFKTEVLERLYPQLDINSIWLDKAKGIRREIFSKYENDKKVAQGWKNKDGKDFIDNIDDIQFLPKFKQLADVSDLTYKKVLNLDVDWVSQKGKSFNDVVLKDGSKLYDKLDFSRVGIVVKEDGYRDAQILLQDIDKDYLKEIIKDSKSLKDSNWANLDIKSVFADAEGKVVKDFREWKTLDGKQWKLDLDKAYISSEIEEISRLPRITGKKRLDKKSGEYKHITYQNNGTDGKLGTELNENLVTASVKNESQMKLLTWGPDILTRVPVAATTIALIPWTLKNVFGLEKSKKKKEQNVQMDKAAELKPAEQNKSNDKVSFKRKAKDPEKVNWFIKQFGKYYGKPIIESPWIAKVSEKLNNMPGKLTQHMMTLGSMITSSVYMLRTMQNKDLDPERKKTLAINQGLCFLIPTGAAYTVDKVLNKHVKNFEYRVSNKMQYAQDMATFKGTDVPKFARNKKNVKGIRILSSICVFSLTYRYVTPVIVTPFANWLGNLLNAKSVAKKEAAKEIALESEANKAKEISINDNKNAKNIA